MSPYLYLGFVVLTPRVVASSNGNIMALVEQSDRQTLQIVTKVLLTILDRKCFSFVTLILRGTIEDLVITL